MRNRKKNRKIPDHIILNILNKAASAEDEVLDYYYKNTLYVYVVQKRTEEK